MKIQESGEMYLETILLLSKKMEHVRSVNVASEMGFSKPSVSRALGLLKDGGYVVTDDEGFIYLTDLGRDTATKIYDRHTVLTAMLRHIGVSAETAENDACRIEHIISDETFEVIKKQYRNIILNDMSEE